MRGCRNVVAVQLTASRAGVAAVFLTRVFFLFEILLLVRLDLMFEFLVSFMKLVFAPLGIAERLAEGRDLGLLLLSVDDGLLLGHGEIVLRVALEAGQAFFELLVPLCFTASFVC